MKTQKNNTELSQILHELNLSERQIEVILLVKNKLNTTPYDINLAEIARELGVSREAIRQTFTLAIDKMLASSKSEYFFGKHSNPQLARRLRKIAISISRTPYTNDFPNFYSFFQPFYNKTEIEEISTTLTQSEKILLNSIENIGQQRDFRNYNLPKIYVFFKLIEKTFQKLINKYGWKNENGYIDYLPPDQPSPPKKKPKKILSTNKYYCQEPDTIHIPGYKVKGIYNCVETNGYLRWQIDEVIKELTEPEITLFKKAYGPYFINPTSAFSRKIKLSHAEALAIMRLKNKIRTLLNHRYHQTQEKFPFGITYDDYIHITNFIQNNFTIDKNLNSVMTRNNIIVFLFLGIGESRPMSVQRISQIYNLSSSEVREIILRFLKTFKADLETNQRFMNLINKIAICDEEGEELKIYPPKRKPTPKRKRRKKISSYY